MRGRDGRDSRRAPGGGRRRFVGLGAALASGALWPAPAAAAAAAISASTGRTRIEVPLDPGTAWRFSAAKDPPRLILDLPGMAPRGPARLPGAGLVAEARRAGGGLVLLLAAPVAAPVTGARGGDLVIELFPGPAAGFARLADGRALAAAPPPPRAPLPLVVLDPGHGGRDPGAIGANGTQEKRITLSAAFEVKRRLEAGGRCRVLLTRGRDVFVPLADRIGLARRREAALFISLHADSAPGARGASVYTLSETASDALSAALARRENEADRAGGLRLPSVSPEVGRILLSLMRQETRAGSDRLARLAVSSLRGEVPLLPNAHRRAAFVVLKAPDVPAALVEMGFLSHPADEAALNRPAHRARLAAALAGAVEGFLLARARSSLAAAAGGATPG
jgi:N-acetylmuramoyl-L-alanine amidase